MRNWIPAIVAIALGATLAIREWALSGQIKSLQQAQDEQLAQQRELIERLDRLEERGNSQPETESPAVTAEHAGTPAHPALDASDVRQRIERLEKELARINARISPEYDPTSSAPEPEPQPDATKRNWGAEQITGPPDVDRDGDSTLAWAALQADAGPEWLSAGFPKTVEIAQVRIRESYNAGAIVKVTAMANGIETTLWEGVSARGKAPRDFVVSAAAGIVANTIVVHMDTTRVTGWNEIDAIELVGRDGSRQWASSAIASSSYADRSVATAQPTDSASGLLFRLTQ